MDRPQDLHLLPDETYPTERLISEEIKTTPLVMKNMTQMADFTFKLYMQKVESMKEAMVGLYHLTINVQPSPNRFYQASFKDVYESIPTEGDAEMAEEPTTSEPAAPAPVKQREQRKVEKKEFVPTTIRNEVDIDVSMLERNEQPNQPADDKEATEGGEKWRRADCSISYDVNK